MTVLETLEQYSLFDVAVLHHGFAPYLRDYELLVETDWTEGAAGRYQYLFTHCVNADYETRVREDVWPESWDDVLTDYERYLQAGEPSGFVWGVNWALAYPGWEYHADSPRAKSWSERLGHLMHEVSLETNAYLLRLIFHDVRVQKVNDDTDLIRRVFIPFGE
ncbi:MAG TPA: hypothetical protein VFG50_02335 [Rhodothermales bacterium]|nr:hypothetical protein [Rhodothermales bacterium]